MRRLLWAAAVLAAVSVGLPAAAQLDPHEVQVRDNFYDPLELRVPYGEEVTWVFGGSMGHTVTAEDGRFDFDPAGAVPSGERRRFRVGNTDEVIRYYCRFHGARGGIGMHGYLLVGNAVRPTPSPTPVPTPPPQRFVGPGQQFETISAALTGAPAQTVISVSPGTYTEGNLRIRERGIVVRGTGTSPADVVVNASGRQDGFYSAVHDVRVENLTVRNATRAGVYLEGDNYAVRDVVTAGNRAWGVAAVGASGGTISGVEAYGSSEAGITVRACRNCDTIVRDVRASGNGAGYWGVNSAGVAVRDSAFTSNATGVILSTALAETDPPGRGTHLVGNLIENNRGVSVPAPSGPLRAPAGVGVWVAGGAFDRIEGNTVTGHPRFGIVVSAFQAPNVRTTVTANTVSDSGENADLAWDGLGAGVCFSGNGANPGSQPPMIQTLYPCESVATAGVPQAQVTLLMLAAALGA